MGIPTVPNVEKGKPKKKGTNLPMEGTMKSNLDSALKDLKDVYGDEAYNSAEDMQSSGDELGETGINLKPMPM